MRILYKFSARISGYGCYLYCLNLQKEWMDFIGLKIDDFV